MFRVVAFSLALTLSGIAWLPTRGADAPEQGEAHALENDAALLKQASDQGAADGFASLAPRLAELEQALARGKAAIAQAEAVSAPFVNPYPLIGVTLYRYYASVQRQDDALRVIAAAAQLLSKHATNATYCELDVRVARAELLTNIGRGHEALPDIEFGLAAPNGSPKYRALLLLLYGRALLNADRAADAVTAFKEVLAIEPGNGDAQNRLGLAEYLQRTGKKLGDMQSIVAVQATAPGGPPPAMVRTVQPAMAVGRTHDCVAYYPADSKAAGESGDVVISYDVGDDGSILNVKLARSSGHDGLDRAALSCAREQWRDTPAMIGTTPVVSPGHQAIVRFSIH